MPKGITGDQWVAVQMIASHWNTHTYSTPQPTHMTNDAPVFDEWLLCYSTFDSTLSNSYASWEFATFSRCDDPDRNSNSRAIVIGRFDMTETAVNYRLSLNIWSQHHRGSSCRIRRFRRPHVCRWLTATDRIISSALAMGILQCHIKPAIFGYNNPFCAVALTKWNSYISHV